MKNSFFNKLLTYKRDHHSLGCSNPFNLVSLRKPFAAHFMRSACQPRSAMYSESCFALFPIASSQYFPFSPLIPRWAIKQPLLAVKLWWIESSRGVGVVVGTSEKGGIPQYAFQSKPKRPCQFRFIGHGYIFRDKYSQCIT